MLKELNLKRIEMPIAKIVEGNWNNNEKKAMKGQLLVQPEYQREFIYDSLNKTTKESRKVEVVKSVFRNLLRDSITLYKLSDEEAKEYGYKYECIDGQQRLTSLCLFVAGDFSVQLDDDGNAVKYADFTMEEKEIFLNRKLYVDVYEGSRGGLVTLWKMKNIFTPVQASDIEVELGMFYRKDFVKKCKALFNENNRAKCLPCFKGFMASTSEEDFKRFKTLEKCLTGFADFCGYNNRVELLQDADENTFKDFRKYLGDVFNWVEYNFDWLKTVGRGNDAKDDKWFNYYNENSDKTVVDGAKEKYIELMEDEEVTAGKKGVINYLLNGKLCALNLRQFTDGQIAKKLAEQGFVDYWTGEPLDIKDAVGDHLVPWIEGGKTTYDNLVVCSARTNAHRSDSGSRTRY